MLSHLSAIFDDFTMYQIEHVDKLSMLSMAIQFSYLQMELKVELSTGDRDHYSLSV